MMSFRSGWLAQHGRFSIAVLTGVAIFFVLPQHWPGLTRALVAWNAAVLLFVPLVFLHHSGLSARQLRTLPLR
jgi:uncharacterized membrane protein